MEGGERLKWGSPLGGPRHPAGMGLPPASAAVGVGSSMPFYAFPPRPCCKTGAGSGGRFKQRGCLAGMSNFEASWRGEGFLFSNLKKNVTSHTCVFSLPAFSLYYKGDWNQACRMC